MEDFKLKATNPQQYDAPDLDWRVGGDVNDSSRLFFRSYLIPELEDLKGKSVLDIGSGVGHMFPTLQELGASDIQGLEPSKRNVEYSRGLYPNITIHEGTLQNFIPEKLFDVAICIMAFEHIFDIKDAFFRIAKIIKSDGNFYLMIGDKDYHIQGHLTKDNFIQTVDVQELGDGVVATKTVYPNAVLYDVFRPLQLTVDTARQSGFELKKQMGMAKSGDKPSCHLLIFKRQ